MNTRTLGLATTLAGLCLISSSLSATWVTGMDIGCVTNSRVDKDVVTAPTQYEFTGTTPTVYQPGYKVLVSTDLDKYDSQFFAVKGGWKTSMNDLIDVTVGLRLELAWIDADYRVDTWHQVDSTVTHTGKGVVSTDAEAYTPEIYGEFGFKLTENLSITTLLAWGRSSMHYDAYSFGIVQTNLLSSTLPTGTVTYSPSDVRLSRTRFGLGVSYAFTPHFSGNIGYEIDRVDDFNLENTVHTTEEGTGIQTKIPVTRLITQRLTAGFMWAW